MSDMSTIRTFLAFGKYLSLQIRLYDGRGKAVACWNVDSRYPRSEKYRGSYLRQNDDGSGWVEYEVVPVVTDVLATVRRFGLSLPAEILHETKHLVEYADGYEYQAELLGALFSWLRVTPG